MRFKPVQIYLATFSYLDKQVLNQINYYPHKYANKNINPEISHGTLQPDYSGLRTKQGKCETK